jgi:hypothetical protein
MLEDGEELGVLLGPPSGGEVECGGNRLRGHAALWGPGPAGAQVVRAAVAGATELATGSATWTAEGSPVSGVLAPEAFR